MEFIKNILQSIMQPKSDPTFSKPEGYKNLNASSTNNVKTKQ